ncbi:MAG: hypothetical protein U0V74_02010 [Chitinophagales bacterium]
MKIFIASALLVFAFAVANGQTPSDQPVPMQGQQLSGAPAPAANDHSKDPEKGPEVIQPKAFEPGTGSSTSAGQDRKEEKAPKADKPATGSPQ